MKTSLLTALALRLSLGLFAQNWIPVPSGTSDAIADLCFPTETTGFYLTYTGKIFNSTDGGMTWTLIHQETDLYADCSIVVTPDSIFCDGRNFFGDAFRVKSPVAAFSFTKQPISQPWADPEYWHGEIWDISRVNACLGDLGSVEKFSVRGASLSASSATKVFLSNDFGKSWVVREFTPSPLSSYPYLSYYNGTDTLVTVTNYPSMIYLSEDHGNTWRSYATPIPKIVPYFLNGHAFLTSTDSTLSHTRDAGLSYTTTHFPQLINGVLILPSGTSFLYGNGGMLFRSANAGGLSSTRPGVKKKICLRQDPVNDRVYLSPEPGYAIHTIALFDLAGEKIREFSPFSTVLSLEGIPPGGYVLLVDGEAFRILAY